MRKYAYVPRNSNKIARNKTYGNLHMGLLRLRPHVFGYFGKRTFFLRFPKNTSLTDRQRIGIVFACLFEIVNQWKYDGIPYGACVVLVVNDAWHHCIRNQRFQKISLWRTFQKRCVFCDRFGGIRVDGRPNRREKTSAEGWIGFLLIS